MASLLELFNSHATDKNTIHSYGPFYEERLKPYQDSAEAVLEIGIQHGVSLRLWRAFFTKAVIYGVDNDPKTLFQEERIVCAYADQRRRSDLLAVAQGKQFDVIIDDGPHHLEAQVLSLFYLWPYLKPGGLYCIEDIQDPTNLAGFACFENVTVYDLRHKKGRYDDLLVMIPKRQ
jgi:trans-aconitate methyltransferase